MGGWMGVWVALPVESHACVAWLSARTGVEILGIDMCEAEQSAHGHVACCVCRANVLEPLKGAWLSKSGTVARPCRLEAT